ncbi:dipeptide ABC transporter ATP-binding protein [Paenibacillaceae bacterium]|nr:dipeptide ABC transporter ATP-binding protein [Paenibacillaceae bacterium]
MRITLDGLQTTVRRREGTRLTRSTEPAGAARKPLLEVRNLQKHYRVNGGAEQQTIKAVNNVSLQLYDGETYGLVGESGCGKSTLGKTLLRLLPATSGEVHYEGKNLFQLREKEMRQVRQHLQMVFQDPYTSLNPRKRVGSIIGEGLKIHGVRSKAERRERVLAILEKIGLQPEHVDRFPHELSGGQRQRIGLARALVLQPRLVVCDEPVSALDVIIQSQIVNLMRKLQQELRLTYLFIAHDISVVRYVSDRIGVMYLGRLVEEADTNTLFTSPKHPYTKVLLSSVPVPDPTVKRTRIPLTGELPSPLDLPSGCVFHTRCPYATARCRDEEPAFRQIAPNHSAACHLQDD